MDDYGWFEDHGAALDSCLTFVRGRDVDAVMRILGGETIGRIKGISDMYEHAMFDITAVTELDGGVLIAEAYSTLGLKKKTGGALSAGGAAVATVYHSQANDARFIWAVDGEIRSDFDYGNAWYREGSDPDALIDVLTTLGFNLTEDDPDGLDFSYDEDASARAFTLVEHLTGMRLTESVMTGNEFALVRMPANLMGC
ncbi:hypothetical protein Ait01nite_057730 [Actinoplanes italicus]|uniref:Uncharacterized protein n=1 Tax=Actinoplanes italicus TaxID=113567 RepID=A0A2T0K5U6_9ACTN|nr:DUF6461 domain-containing protein [Actinoplanes italicus]PRX18320.1 hypothetical protein CLV67_113154 [Actinoplanes italicus]GIE32728.1 hypothetical protein Ait01nite_057730 [Actinoplanes italicus]